MCLYVHVCGSICQDVVVCALVILHVYTHIHDRGGGADATVARMHLYMAICVSMRTITYEHIQAHTACMCLYVLLYVIVCEQLRACMCLYVIARILTHTSTYKCVRAAVASAPPPLACMCVYLCVCELSIM